MATARVATDWLAFGRGTHTPRADPPADTGVRLDAQVERARTSLADAHRRERRRVLSSRHGSPTARGAIDGRLALLACQQRLAAMAAAAETTTNHTAGSSATAQRRVQCSACMNFYATRTEAETAASRTKFDSLFADYVEPDGTGIHIETDGLVFLGT